MSLMVIFHSCVCLPEGILFLKLPVNQQFAMETVANL